VSNKPKKIEAIYRAEPNTKLPDADIKKLAAFFTILIEIDQKQIRKSMENNPKNKLIGR
jgi:hypothetical protein